MKVKDLISLNFLMAVTNFLLVIPLDSCYIYRWNFVISVIVAFRDKKKGE
jgi:hypothetical protein